MSIRLLGTAPARTKLEIKYAGERELELILLWCGSEKDYVKSAGIRLNTKELVMAIKQIEEERYERFSSGPDSRETRTREYGVTLKGITREARTELGEMLRDVRCDHIHLEEIAAALRDISYAKGPGEVYNIVDRLKEKYFGTTGSEAWSIKIYHLAEKERFREGEIHYDFGGGIDWSVDGDSSSPEEIKRATRFRKDY